VVSVEAWEAASVPTAPTEVVDLEAELEAVLGVDGPE